MPFKQTYLYLLEQCYSNYDPQHTTRRRITCVATSYHMCRDIASDVSRRCIKSVSRRGVKCVAILSQIYVTCVVTSHQICRDVISDVCRVIVSVVCRALKRLNITVLNYEKKA
jgi:hypothetical protein